MSKERKFTIKPPLLGLNGQPVREVTLNIGTNPPGATGVGGATGPAGNPALQVTAPNGSIWQIVVDNSGNLSTESVG
jgi:hypothetical protein